MTAFKMFTKDYASVFIMCGYGFGLGKNENCSVNLSAYHRQGTSDLEPRHNQRKRWDAHFGSPRVAVRNHFRLN